MEQSKIQEELIEKYNYILDSLDDYKDVNECEFYADKLSFEGYGQNTGGYIGYKGVNNPSQKFHLITAYFQYNFDRNRRCCLNRVKCPQIILWIAEIVGIDKDRIIEGYNYIRKAEDKLFKENPKGLLKVTEYWKTMENLININEFKNILQYKQICKMINDSKNWEDVIKNCSEL